MDPAAAMFLVFLVLAVSFNGREVIRRSLSRVPVLFRSRRSSR
jgi:hypothetical protein